jgi:hypothetical protein
MDAMDPMRGAAQEAFFACFRAASASVAAVEATSHIFHQWLESNGVRVDKGLIFLAVLVLLSFGLAVFVYLTAVTFGRPRQAESLHETAYSTLSAPCMRSTETDVFCCMLCTLDLRDDSQKAIDLHTKGKRHIRNVEKAKMAHAPHKNNAVLKWMVMDTYKALHAEAHGILQDEHAEQLREQEPLQDAKLHQVIRAAGRNVAVVHDGSFNFGQVDACSGLEQPVQLSNYMTSFVHIEHGKNVLSDLGVWVKFLTASQEAQLVRSAEAILLAAQSKKARGSTLIPARGNDFASISFGCLYDIRKQEVSASVKVEMMPSSFAEVSRRILANADALRLPSDMSVDAATVLVVEEGMHISPHNFGAAGLRHPVFMVVCAGEVDMIFGTEIKSLSREGQYVPTGSSIRLNRRSMLVFGETMCQETMHAVSCVPARVLLAVFYGLPHELQVRAQAAGNLKCE